MVCLTKGDKRGARADLWAANRLTRGSGERLRDHGRIAHWLEIRYTRVTEIIGQNGVGEGNRYSPIGFEFDESANARAGRTLSGLERPLFDCFERRWSQRRMSGEQAVIGHGSLRGRAEPDGDRPGNACCQRQWWIGRQDALVHSLPHLFRLRILNPPAIQLRRNSG